jgi:hypothetical protein
MLMMLLMVLMSFDGADRHGHPGHRWALYLPMQAA